MRFWDASAVIPLILREATTPTLLDLHRLDPDLSIWWGTRVECISAIARALREGRIDQPADQTARRRVSSLTASARETAPSEEVRDRAERLLTVHPLRAADALQLAAALVSARERPTGRGFVSLDNRLKEAASREGFTVLP